METALKKDVYEHQALVFAGTAGRETSEEYVVPDALPDIGAVVDAEGVLTLRGKETETGYVQLSASVSVSVMYMPEDGGAMRSLTLTLPADIRMEAQGADADCRTVARMRVRSVDARVINSRKIAVRAELEAEAQCYRREGLQIASDLEENGGAAHLLTRTAEAMMISDVREKTFVTTDEYQMPAGADDILSRRVEAAVEDVKYAGGKVIFRGRVRSELIFSAKESGSPCAGRYETEFSQIMEVDADGEEAMPEVSLLLTGAYFDLPEYGQEQGRLAAEFHFAAQSVCRERRQLRYIADVYSNRTALVPETEDVSIASDVRPITMRQTVAGRTEPFPADGEALSVSACVGGVSVENGTVKTSVNIRLITRRRDGGCVTSRCRLTAEFTSPEIGENDELRDITVTVTDVYSTGADVRVTLQMDALAVTRDTVSCVSAVEEDAEGWQNAERVPSATLIRVPAGTDLWPVARRYHSTLEAIAAANEGRQDGLLLIPKGR